MKRAAACCQQQDGKLPEQGREVLQPGGEQGQQAQVEQQEGLYPGGEVNVAFDPLTRITGLYQRGGQCQQVDAKQDAQHDAEVAEVR